MHTLDPTAPAVPLEVVALTRLIAAAAAVVDYLFEVGQLEAAEDLDALLAEAEELLEDNGDFEEGADLENDELSEVDEDGGHEFATALPEDEVHDDDLDFAYGRGRYAATHCARYHDDTDEDLDFASTNS